MGKGTNSRQGARLLSRRLMYVLSVSFGAGATSRSERVESTVELPNNFFGHLLSETLSKPFLHFMRLAIKNMQIFDRWD